MLLHFPSRLWWEEEFRVSSLVSQTAVWAPAPLRKGLLPLLLASAGYLVLILSHFFLVGSIFGTDMLSTLFLPLAIPSKFSQLTGPLAIQLFPFFFNTKSIQIKALKIMLMIKDVSGNLIQLCKCNYLPYKQSRISLYGAKSQIPNSHWEIPWGEASGFLGHLEELFTSLEAGLCKWVTCWLPTSICGSPVLCRETWMSQLPPVLCRLKDLLWFPLALNWACVSALDSLQGASRRARRFPYYLVTA